MLCPGQMLSAQPRCKQIAYIMTGLFRALPLDVFLVAKLEAGKEIKTANAVLA